MGLKIGIVGATGAVGQKMIEVVDERIKNIDELLLFASEKSQGKVVKFRGQNIIVQKITKEAMEQRFDYLLFSAGGEVSSIYGPIAAEAGNIVIDNSSFWRMTEGVPLIIPEVNGGSLKGYRGIVANPNCSTIQMVAALAPLHRAYGVKKIVVSTYQAVSGSGFKGLNELKTQRETGELEPKFYSRTILGNCIPHIDSFEESGYTKEEMKMVNETRKILDNNTLEINPTAVRIPVEYGHSESIYAEFETIPDIKEASKLLSGFEGIKYVDDNQCYITPMEASNTDLIYVSRLRKDLFNQNALSMWVVADNVRKGAATNAVQIIETFERLKG
jgi:aspartate-semialdehyde dehydrogenase